MENEVKEPAPKYNYITSEEYLSEEREAFSIQTIQLTLLLKDIYSGITF